MEKKFIVLTAIITIISVLLFIACGGEEEEPHKNQSATITGLFEGNHSATVKGYMKDSEWEGVVEKIKTNLITAHANATGPSKSRFGNAFEYNDVEIIVEIYPVGYTKWKTTSNGKTMYLAFGALNNDLQGSLTDAVAKMAAGEAGFVQAIDSVKLPNIFFS
jgi:hypothetical protein